MMRVTLVVAGLMLLAVSGPWRKRDTAFSAGSTNLLLAANGGHVVAFSSQMLDENRQPVPQWQVSNPD